MNTILRLFSILGLALIACHVSHADDSSGKTRIIATTDGEIDDRCTMVRFLLYANEWDIEGIVHSSSKYHWKGDETHEGKDWHAVQWLDKRLDAYEKVYPNLKKHDSSYPTPDYLRSQVFVGNISHAGDMAKPTPGSDHIVKALLDPNPSPIWLQAWGGANTIARALKTIKDEHPDRVEEVTQKARLFLITEQDKTLREYILPEWPGLQVLLSDWSSFNAIGYPWEEYQPKELHPYFDKSWMTTNVLEQHGPLCAMYEAIGGRFRSEGDTPSFLHVIDTGLRGDEHPTYGGWGGRFVPFEGFWKTEDVRNVWPHSILRWAKDFQNDWEARSDWCVKPVADANHPPQVKLKHEQELSARLGESITLDASDSSDPDDDNLSFDWWIYNEAGTYPGTLEINQKNGKPVAQLIVPAGAIPGSTIHAVCSVTDAGDPPLTRYARVVIKIEK